MGYVNAARRLYLHVGCPKTGTTFLQDTFWESRQALAAYGLYLPLRNLQDHFYLSLAVREQVVPELDPPEAHRVLDRLTDDMAHVKTPRVLISHELFAPATAEQAARFRSLLSGFEVHVVLTVRDLLRQIPAAWQQQIQQRGLVSYETFLDAVVADDAETAYFWDRQDAPAIAERWRGNLPPKRVHIVTVPPSGADQGLLLERFCRVVETDPAALDRDLARRNESLGVVQAELLRRVNIALGDRLPHPRAGHGRIAKGYFARQVLVPQGGVRPELPVRLFEWCCETSERMIERLAAGGYDIAGSLDELRPTTPSTEPTGAVVTDAALIDSAVAALADLLDQRQQDVRRIGRQRERIASLERSRRIRRGSRS
jgi:hypothetical protein